VTWSNERRASVARPKVYEVQVKRTGGRWVVTVPELELTAVAPKLADIEWTAQEVIGVKLRRRSEDVRVSVGRTPIPALADYEAAQERRDDALLLESRASLESKLAIARLVNVDGISKRDVAELTGLTYQRVSQIVRELENVDPTSTPDDLHEWMKLPARADRRGPRKDRSSDG
jgi:hypothetical protein